MSVLVPKWHDQAGCYSLIIELRKRKTVRIGRLGVGVFPKGIYVYTGSAMKGLGARLERHLGRKKTLHWHIDYLLAPHETEIKKIVIYRAAPGQECRQNQRIAALPGAAVVLKGFGASDCHSGCASHLSFFSSEANSKFTAGSIILPNSI